MKHPLQPLETDERGIQRFKSNAIVWRLLHTSPLDLNQISAAVQEGVFPLEDYQQLLQLLGLTLCSYGEYGQVSDEDYERAARSGWTKDVPTSDGAYWLKKPNRPATLVAVRPELHGFPFTYSYIGDETPRYASDLFEGSEWYGPIEPPE